MSETTLEVPAMRYVVAKIPEDAAIMFRDLGVKEGDVIIAPDGFPDDLDMEDPPAVELRRALHPNVAWFIRGYAEKQGFLEPLTEEGARS